jgi:hypothetical protein
VKKISISLLSIILIVIIYLAQIFITGIYKQKGKIICHDVINYYAYLPATFIEKDYKLREWKYEEPWKDRYWPRILANGNGVMKMSMGLSMMYAPFFFIAHFITPYTTYESNGFTPPYALALIFSCIFYMFWGLLALRKVLLKSFNETITTITLLTICLTTNLYWYATMEAPMSHAYSFALFGIFIYFTECWYQKQSIKNTVILGLLYGLITLIRPTNALVIILFAGYGIKNISDLKMRIQFLFSNYRHIFIFTFSTFIVLLPQLLYWKSTTGQFVYYSYGETERFFFKDPKIWDVLFGFRKGWFIYSPSMLFAVVGMFFLWKYKKEYALITPIYIILHLYIISSWWCWWYGGGFGMRACIECSAVLSIPLAAFLKWMFSQKMKIKVLLISLYVVVSLQSGFHLIQYHYEAIHYESMTHKAYKDSFWKIKPSDKFHTLLKTPAYSEARKGNR